MAEEPTSGSQPEEPDMQELLRQLSQLIGGDTSGSSDPNLDQIMQQIQQTLGQLGMPQGADSAAAVNRLSGMFGGPPPEGGVNWDLAKETARKTSAQLGPDPVPSHSQRERMREAVTIAEVWLNDVTDFPAVGGEPQVWSRAEWIESTQPVWQRLVEPVASRIADAMETSMIPGDVPAEMAGMEKMLAPLMRTSGAGMFGIQLGQALAQLANEVVGVTDIGLPLHDRIAFLPNGVEKFGEGLDQSATDVAVYLALRECARQRLFQGTSWLRSTLLTLVEEYARGITIDTAAIENALSDFEPTNIEELQERLTGSLFKPAKTNEQQAVLVRLETMLALVEGWVDHVVSLATQRWMPAAVPLAETMRRRRATGGPAEATFASLVGLELRPRRLRDAANLWAAMKEKRGATERDQVWSHPDLVPGAEDLDDPLGFVQSGPRRGRHTDDGESSAADFDAELAKLLDGEMSSDGEAEPESDNDNGGPTAS